MNEPEARHRACWYGRRTGDIPADIGFHTIADGQLLFCAHPMWYPVVGYQFDVRNCDDCEYFRVQGAGVLPHPRSQSLLRAQRLS